MKGYSLQKAQNMLKINRKKSEDNMRDFEKISFEQFKKDVVDDIDLYDEYRLPQRDSNSTAGYDIYLLEDLVIEPNEIFEPIFKQTIPSAPIITFALIVNF